MALLSVFSSCSARPLCRKLKLLAEVLVKQEMRSKAFIKLLNSMLINVGICLHKYLYNRKLKALPRVIRAPCRNQGEIPEVRRAYV